MEEVPETVCFDTRRPSTRSVNVRVLALDPVTAMGSVFDPVRVPPSGVVKLGTRVAVRLLATVTVRVVVAVRPAESVTVAVSVCDALLTLVVFHPTVLLAPQYTLTPSTASL